MTAASKTTKATTSSSSSSSSGASASSSSSPKLSKRLQEKLYECVAQQPVTIVVGPTGCGKSTLVPHFLMNRLGGAVLCTQPRRLAVVAVASRVAHEMECELGGKDIGYHVGAANHCLHDTQLVYTTAGILLEEMRCQGAAQALQRYKCIVIDECHERSAESDLVLALLRHVFLYKRKYPAAFVRNLRIVLMSATFDHEKYRQYFQGVLGGSSNSIDIINLETADSFQAFYDRVNTHYLDSILPLLPDKENHKELQQQMRVNPDEALLSGHDGGKTLPERLLNFLISLVQYLDQKNEDAGAAGVFLIFAPTYRQLEQIYERLHSCNPVHRRRAYNSTSKGSDQWKIGVLHSSVDMEFCLRNMMDSSTISSDTRNGVRKILLASAVADSSVTVPGVSVVIDLCRSLSVTWDYRQEGCKYVAKTVWSSQSICDQRRGRTGRTCAGNVYRLVPQHFYLSRLQAYEAPQLTASSCRNEILKLLCTTKQQQNDKENTKNKSTAATASDPTAILRQCLDPPPARVTSMAMDYLVKIRACIETTTKHNRLTDGSRQWIPTHYGELLATLPFTVHESTVIIKGGQLGLLHETLALQAIRSHKPSPIVHHFANEYANEDAMAVFYPDVDVKDSTSMDMANLAAFMFWDSQWNGEHRRRATSLQFGHVTSGGDSGEDHPDFAFTNELTDNPNKACCDVWKWTSELEEKHTEWCEQYNINPTAVRGIAELLESTWNILFHAEFEPEWLRCTDPTPLWRRKSDWKGLGGDANDMLSKVYGGTGRVRRLHYALATLNKDPLAATLENTGLALGGTTTTHMLQQHNRAAEPLACVFFLQGSCTYGSKCRNSHSALARRPPCKFYQTSGFCARGENCVFSHAEENNEKLQVTKQRSFVSTVSTETDPLKAMAPLKPNLFIKSTVDWFKQHCDQLMLLGEGSFEFTRELERMNMAPFSSSTNGDAGRDVSLFGGSRVFNVDATRIHQEVAIIDMFEREDVNTFAWNFPFTGLDEDVESHESLILGTLYSLKLLGENFRCTPNQTMTFAMTLQGDQLARWNVLRSAYRTGWYLTAWGEFDSKDYSSYHPRRANGERFPASCARFYVFRTTTFSA